jgi:hypothetical protein
VLSCHACILAGWQGVSTLLDDISEVFLCVVSACGTGVCADGS